MSYLALPYHKNSLFCDPLLWYTNIALSGRLAFCQIKIKFKRNVKLSCSGGDKELPIQDRWDSRHYTLDKIFTHSEISVDNELEICNYYNVESWSGLLAYYKNHDGLKKPLKSIIKPYEFKG